MASLSDEARNMLVSALRRFGSDEIYSVLNDLRDTTLNGPEDAPAETSQPRRRKRGGFLSGLFGIGQPKDYEKTMDELVNSGAELSEPDYDPVSGGSQFTTFKMPDGVRGYFNSRGKTFETYRP